jgi:hypothetical protein
MTSEGQPSLFPPWSRPGTSLEAACSMAGSPAHASRRKVLACIRSKGAFGATDDEIMAETGMDPNTVRPRRWELAGLDRRSTLPTLIASNGEKRLTRRGRRAMVWVAVEFLSEEMRGNTDRKWGG